MQLSNAIRQRIINLVKNRKTNMKKLCEISDVNYSTLISFMTGSTKILTLNTLYKLCLGLKIDLVDFFDDKMFQDTLDEHEKNQNKK